MVQIQQEVRGPWSAIHTGQPSSGDPERGGQEGHVGASRPTAVLTCVSSDVKVPTEFHSYSFLAVDRVEFGPQRHAGSFHQKRWKFLVYSRI